MGEVADTPGADALFGQERARLWSVAYRMLGSRADAEDVLQDAWLRWQASDVRGIHNAQAWLVTTVTRLCIDRLRRLRTERELYTGPWLPEPLVATEPPPADAAAELASDLSVALLAVLERLAPEERAAFLLREAFDVDYADIARILGKSEAACRQLVSRAARFDLDLRRRRQGARGAQAGAWRRARGALRHRRVPQARRRGPLQARHRQWRARLCGLPPGSALVGDHDPQ
jgi:RNA polymerase sigma factor (sigma-70 family)